MITIIDGMPGAGKTQYAIAKILKQTQKENRPVYYYGIPDLNIEEWKEIENPELWDQLPDGAIVVLDEAQRVFKLRQAGTEKPQRTVALETHRHKGHDLILITQDGTLLDIQCRKLCNNFYHLKRIAGTGRVSVTEYAEFVNHNDYHERKKSVGSSVWKHDKKIWKLYKSATIHTVKPKLPKKLLMLPVIAGVGMWAVWNIYSSWFSGEPHFVQSAIATSESFSPGQKPEIQNDLTPQQYKVQEKLEYFGRYEPRIRDKPETAPVYDSLRTVQSYPRMQCISSPDHGCKCYTQQATRLNISEKNCKDFIVAGQTFDHASPDNALILANTLPDEEEPDWKTIDGANPWDDTTGRNDILVLSKREYETNPLKYAKHDRGSMNIDRVVKTD